MSETSFLRFVPAISEALDGERAVVVGGLPTDALLTDGAIFSASERRLIIPREAAAGIPAVRANGTPRDIDVMAFTTDRGETARLQAGLTSSLRLLAQRAFMPEVSVSGYDSPDRAGVIPWVQFVSQTLRTSGEVVLKAGQVEIAMPATDLEDTTWQLAFGTNDTAPSIPMFAPPIHAGRYTTRSLTGIRPKDASKVAAMEGVLQSAELPPGVMELANPFRLFQQRIKKEISWAEAVRLRNPRVATLAVGRHVLARLEGNSWLIGQVQGGHGLVAMVASRGIRTDNDSYNSTAV